MTRYNEGDWVTYRHHEGFGAKGKVLETRPDGYLVVGQHDQDPNPVTVDPDDVTGYVDG